MPEVTLEQVQKGVTDLGDTVTKAQENTSTEIKAVKDEVTGVKDEVKAVKEAQEQINSEFNIIKAKAGRKSGETEQKDFKDLVVDVVKDNADQFKAFAGGSIKELSFGLTGKAVQDMTAPTNLTGNYPKEYESEVVALPSRKLHLRSLFGVGRTSERTHTYYQETGGEGGVASQNPEGATKSQLDFDLTEKDAPVRTIAGFTVISRQMLNNIPGMMSFLQKRLPELYLREEDRQLLNGSGNNSELAGLLPAVAAASTTDTDDLGAILDTIGEIEDVDHDVNGILLRPSDYWRILKVATLNKPDVVVIDPTTGRLTIGGIPAYRSTAMTADTALIGDFVLGADILQLTNLNVALSYEDATNFRQNKVTLRVEAEIAFPIYYPNAFRKLDLGNLT
ncbi:phage major capsid protein [Chitinophaga sp.]|uniref:phage major capsid protein n=1 Tax=Chitinophaga sp. TaxID=1869181 RepID=UPI0031D2C911